MLLPSFLPSYLLPHFNVSLRSLFLYFFLSFVHPSSYARLRFPSHHPSFLPSFYFSLFFTYFRLTSFHSFFLLFVCTCIIFLFNSSFHPLAHLSILHSFLLFIFCLFPSSLHFASSILLQFLLSSLINPFFRSLIMCFSLSSILPLFRSQS